MNETKIIQSKSKYFNFNKVLNFNLHKVSKFEGWNELFVLKLDVSKGETILNSYFEKNFLEIYNKEKILVVISGRLSFENEENKFELREYDAVNIHSDEKKYKFFCEEKTIAFVVSAKKLETSTSLDVFFFNFKKDIKPVDLWGGKIISRPYEGKKLNLVLFEIKKGFTFQDQGHYNEQLTWLVDGSMNFYVKDLKKTLSSNEGVDIGPYDLHGGVSDSAIGFDAFFPKREEKKYKNATLSKISRNIIWIKINRSLNNNGYINTFYHLLKYPILKTFNKEHEFK
jgi:quercetin dioxygenase-like cupin family protein